MACEIYDLIARAESVIEESDGADEHRELIDQLSAWRRYHQCLDCAGEERPFCPECDTDLTGRTTNDEGEPTYCDTCDREVVAS